MLRRRSPSTERSGGHVAQHSCLPDAGLPRARRARRRDRGLATVVPALAGADSTTPVTTGGHRRDRPLRVPTRIRTTTPASGTSSGRRRVRVARDAGRSTSSPATVRSPATRSRPSRTRSSTSTSRRRRAERRRPRRPTLLVQRHSSRARRSTASADVKRVRGDHWPVRRSPARACAAEPRVDPILTVTDATAPRDDRR